jgi:DNA-binding transcriptional ArsR family regulator
VSGSTGDAHGGAETVRDVTDVREMRALAHPVRVALLEALREEPTLTATQASELLGETPANCSFHLRTLAKYGFVEEVPGGAGRRRPWRRVDASIRFSVDQEEPAAGAAAEELARHYAARRQRRLEEWLTTRPAYEEAWLDASFVMDVLVHLAPAELGTVREEIASILDRYRHRAADPSARPAGSRPVSLVVTGHPMPPRPVPPAEHT